MVQEFHGSLHWLISTHINTFPYGIIASISQLANPKPSANDVGSLILAAPALSPALASFSPRGHVYTNGMIVDHSKRPFYNYFNE